MEAKHGQYRKGDSENGRHHFSGSVTSFLGCNHPELDRIWELNNKKADAKKIKIVR